jgi:hypothetical protein
MESSPSGAAYRLKSSIFFEEEANAPTSTNPPNRSKIKGENYGLKAAYSAVARVRMQATVRMHIEHAPATLVPPRYSLFYWMRC